MQSQDVPHSHSRMRRHKSTSVLRRKQGESNSSRPAWPNTQCSYIPPHIANDTCPSCNTQLLARGGTYKMPKLLECLHTVCAHCCNNSVRDTVTCMVCGTDSAKDQILDNYPMLRRMESQLISCGAILLCDNCEQLHATWRCDRCSQYLCSGCRDAHLRIKAFKSHLVRAVSSLARESESSDQRPVCCLAHGEEITLYCYDCSEAICSRCHIDAHQMHKVDFVAEAYPNMREKLANADSNARSRQLFLKRQVDTVHSTIAHSQQIASQLKQEVDTSFDELIQMLERRRTDVLNQLEQCTQSKMSLLTMQKEASEMVMQGTTSACEFVEKLFSSEPSEMLLYYRLATKRFEALAAKAVQFEPKLPDDIRYQGEASQLKATVDHFGDILMRPMGLDPVCPYCAEQLSTLATDRCVKCGNLVDCSALSQAGLSPKSVKNLNNRLTQHLSNRSQEMRTEAPIKVVEHAPLMLCNNCEQQHATWRCDQCNQYLCAACKDAHMRIKVFRDHPLRPIEPYSFGATLQAYPMTNHIYPTPPSRLTAARSRSPSPTAARSRSPSPPGARSRSPSPLSIRDDPKIVKAMLNFDAIDANKDGVIDRAEWNRAVQNVQAKIDQGISPKGHHMDFETLQRVAKLGVRLDISDQTHLSNYQRLLLQNLWEQPEL